MFFDIIGLAKAAEERFLEAIERSKLKDPYNYKNLAVIYRDMEKMDQAVSLYQAAIEADPGNPRYIQTVWGVGYQFTPSGSAL